MSTEKTPAKFLVRSRGAQRRRAGISFNREGVVIDPAELTEEQRMAIAEDPELSAMPYVESDATTGASTPKKSGKGGK